MTEAIRSFRSFKKLKLNTVTEARHYRKKGNLFPLLFLLIICNHERIVNVEEVVDSDIEGLNMLLLGA